jgi:type III secretion apparatus needle protein
MDFNAIIDGLDGLINSFGQNMVSAMERASQTGETTDFLRAQQAMSEFNNLVTFKSTSVKYVHDMIAGILQKI